MISKTSRLAVALAASALSLGCGDDSDDAGSGGAPAKSTVGCSVVDNDDGSKTISCDGAEVTVHDGADGANGSDGSQGGAGADGSSCTATDGGDGTKTISCDDGSEFTVSDGATGPAGAEGPAGADALATLTNVEEDTFGACTTSGHRIITGVDDNDDGVLQTLEIDSEQVICGSETPSPVFKSEQVVDGMVLVCASIDGNGLRCRTPALNGQRITSSTATLDHLCDVIIGTSWGGSATSTGTYTNYDYAGGQWTLGEHSTLNGYFSCQTP